jgi:DNA ligase-4
MADFYEAPEAREAVEAAEPIFSAPRLSEAEHELAYPNRPINTKPTPPFHILHTQLFEPLLDNKKKKPGTGLRGNRELKPHETRRNIIDAFISKWRKDVGDDIFPAFRLIMCEKDRDRNV